MAITDVQHIWRLTRMSPANGTHTSTTHQHSRWRGRRLWWRRRQRRKDVMTKRQVCWWDEQHDTPTFNSEEDDNDVEGGSVGRPGWRNARDADETMLCFIVDYFYEKFVLLLSCSHGRCALLRPVLLLLLVAGLLVASARWLVVACVLRGT